MPKQLVLGDRSRVHVTVRATGIAAALHPETTFSAAPEPWSIDDPEGDVELPIEARVRVQALEPPPSVTGGDRERMLDNLRGKDVLDAARCPAITLRGRYVGSRAGGRLTGDLEVRGAARPVSFTVTAGSGGEGGALRVRGEWEGKLTDLGVKPFRALLGALRLSDWVRIRLELELAPRG